MAVDNNVMRKSQSTVAIDLVNDKFMEKMSNIQLLDYIALVLARNMASNIAFKGGCVLRQIMEGHTMGNKGCCWSRCWFTQHILWCSVL